MTNKTIQWPPVPQEPRLYEFGSLKPGSTFRVTGEGRTKFKFVYFDPAMGNVHCHELHRGVYQRWRCFHQNRLK